MKQIKLTEQEKLNILKQHGSKILVEETKGKTIADIQRLLDVKDDNILGPVTLAAIEQKLSQKSGSTSDGTTTTTTTTKVEDTTTTTKQIEPINVATMKATGINKAPTTSGLQVKTDMVGGKTDDSSKESVDSSNP